jgi:Uncharacterized conserved protein
MSMETRSMISFDWAIKRLLRQKANFVILEGFLSELLRRKIIIKSIGESEGNQTDENDKTNRVDILVEADDREIVIIELQYDNENDYFQRMLYGVSKSITDYMYISAPYGEVRKVYSVNIVYFDLGQGDDYVYHGVTGFTGLHTRNELQLTAKQKQLYGKTVASELFPEYYIIKVRGFDDIARDTLDEWIYYLKNSRIRDDFTAQGIDHAREVLSIGNLTDSEKIRFWRSVEERRIKDGEISTALLDGEDKGLKKGLKKGKAIGMEKGLKKGKAIGMEEGKAIGIEKGKAIGEQKKALIIAKNLLKQGLSIEDISNATGLSIQQIEDNNQE